MRVISGAMRGRRLVSPAGWATRPTADRIKESVFNILSGDAADRRVLDLFAGTGALGIEALSRGAESAIFIDQARPAVDAIHRNITNLGLQDRARIIRWDIRKNLNCLASHDPFDLIFMDPPYGTGAVRLAIAALTTCGALSAQTRIIIEHDDQERFAFDPSRLILVDQRRFGKTLVSFVNTVL